MLNLLFDRTRMCTSLIWAPLGQTEVFLIQVVKYTNVAFGTDKVSCLEVSRIQGCPHRRVTL